MIFDIIARLIGLIFTIGTSRNFAHQIQWTVDDKDQSESRMNNRLRLIDTPYVAYYGVCAVFVVDPMLL